MKIVFLNSHPISYFSDMYRFLSNEIDFEVWYCSKYGLNSHFDKEFNTVREISGLLDGFSYRFLTNLNYNSSGREKLLDTINPFIFFNLFKLKKGDIIICHGWSRLTMILIIVFSNIFGIRVGLRSETPIIHEYNYLGIKKILRKQILKLLFKRINYFFYIGSNNKKFYQSLGVNDEKLIFMPYSVNPVSKDHNTTKKRTDSIVFSGKLINKKRPQDLLNAFSRIKSQNSKLFFAGTGNLEEFLQKKVIELNLEKRVKFLGLLNKKELNKLYSTSDIIVLPSGYGETWGLVINEALEYGLPVIVSDMVGSAIDLCDRNGYIFKYKSVKDLSFKLDKLINSSKKDYDNMVMNSFRIKKLYSFETIKNNLINKL
jgi:glycosyltransferase involved in cell wall biosynthesis